MEETFKYFQRAVAPPNLGNSTSPDITTLCQASFSTSTNSKDWNFGVFSGLNTFNVCTTYPNLTTGLIEGLFDKHQIANLTAYNITGSDINLADTLTSQIPRYLHELCNQIHCDKEMQICGLEMMMLDNTTMSAEGLAACQERVCDNTLDFYMDTPDIGGIGVSISYMLQMLMVILILLYIAFQFAHSLYHKHHLKTHTAFIRMCIAFQRTQAWFIIAMIVAAFYSNYKDDVTTIDAGLLAILALHGSVLLSFTQSSLLYLGHYSWYTTMQVSVSYILCTTYFILYLDSPVFITNTDNVTLFCFKQVASFADIHDDERFFEGVSEFGIHMIMAFAFCTVILVITIVGQAYSNIARLFPKACGRISSFRKRFLPSAVLVCLVGGVYAPMMLLQVYLLKQMMKVVDPRDWPFGQVVASQVFLPIIFDYFHDRYFKRERKMVGRHSRSPSELSLQLYDSRESNEYTLKPVLAEETHEYAENQV